MGKVLFSGGLKSRPLCLGWRIIARHSFFIVVLVHGWLLCQRPLAKDAQTASLPHLNFDLTNADRWGIIDKSGGYVIEPAYHAIYYYGANYAVAENFDPHNLSIEKDDSLLDLTGKRLFSACRIKMGDDSHYRCLNSCSDLWLKFKDERVVAWRVQGSDHTSKWLMKNEDYRPNAKKR